MRTSKWLYGALQRRTIHAIDAESATIVIEITRAEYDQAKALGLGDAEAGVRHALRFAQLTQAAPMQKAAA